MRAYAGPFLVANWHPATANADPTIALRTRKPRRDVRDDRRPVTAFVNQPLSATPLLGRSSGA